MCPLGLCDGSGLLDVIDFHGGGLQSCACVYGLVRQAMPAEQVAWLSLSARWQDSREDERRLEETAQQAAEGR